MKNQGQAAIGPSTLFQATKETETHLMLALCTVNTKSYMNLPGAGTGGIKLSEPIDRALELPST